MKRPDLKRLAVIGAGLIGTSHIERILASPKAKLVAVTDPDAGAAQIAQQAGVSYFSTLEAMIAGCEIDGAILATPNHLHLEQARFLIEQGIAVLIEKPIADDVEAASDFVRWAEGGKIPVLIGHHRRHNPLIQKAKSLIDEGEIGQPLSLSMTTWLYKPDAYFNTEWRTRKGAGPVYINLIHDIDLARYFFGNVTQIYAMESHQARGSEVEDTAAILLKFENGALGTITISDSIVAPWSWEHTAHENPAYPTTQQHAYQLGGSRGSLGVPNLALWQAKEEKSWWKPFSMTTPIYPQKDPLVVQLEHFCALIAGEAEPLVSARDGLAALRLIEAVKLSAAQQRPVDMEHLR